MKILIKILFIIAVAVVFVLVAAVRMDLFGGTPPSDLGVASNRLKAPSKNENSVSTQAELFSEAEANVKYAKISPLKFQGSGNEALKKLKEIIRSDFKEANLVFENENYLRYEFKTDLMRFTDDVEFFLIAGEDQIHFRSASRVGRKDLGKNRARMEAIREKFTY